MLTSPERPDGTTTGYHGPERRRYPRTVPADDVKVNVAIVVDAQVLDISTGGALISASNPLQIGERGRLHVLLGREPFNAWVEVRRTHRGTMSESTSHERMGVSFSAVDEASRRNLQRFVKDDSGSTPSR